MQTLARFRKLSGVLSDTFAIVAKSPIAMAQDFEVSMSTLYVLKAERFAGVSASNAIAEPVRKLDSIRLWTLCRCEWLYCERRNI